MWCNIAQWTQAQDIVTRGLASLCGISERVVVLQPPGMDTYALFHDPQHTHFAPLANIQHLSELLLASHIKAFDTTLRKILQQL